MAPSKAAPKLQRPVVKTNITKKTPSVSNTTSTTKNTVTTRKITDKTALKVNNITTEKTPAVSNTTSTIKKTVTTRKLTEKTELKVNNITTDSRQRTNTVPKLASPKPKENKALTVPGSGKKSWKRRPTIAHSGVPLPEKMKRMQK